MRIGVAPLGRGWVAWADAAISRQSAASAPNSVMIRFGRTLGIEPLASVSVAGFHPPGSTRPAQCAQPAPDLARLHRSMRRTMLIAMLAALVATGCGGSDNGDSKTSSSTSTQATGPALTKQEFVTKADAACRRFNDRVKAIPGTAKTPKDAAALYQRVVKEAESFYRTFSSLQPPAKDT